MAEYIEREAAIQTLCGYCFANGNCGHTCKEITALQSIPSADVRPVVLCRDCTYNVREVTDLFGNSAIQCITGLTHRHDWFCADGKKREDS